MNSNSTYYLKDFYDDIKSKQQELINNHSTYCQMGGYSVLSKQFDKLNAQNKLNNIRREVQNELNLKIKNIMQHLQVGGKGKITLNKNIKLLKQMIKKLCKIEKDLLKNIKKQQKCIKNNKLEYLSLYQIDFKDTLKSANNLHKDIKKLQEHINNIIEKKNIKLKNKELNKLLSIKNNAKIATLNNLKSIIDKIKQH
jgi:hypothetical protein